MMLVPTLRSPTLGTVMPGWRNQRTAPSDERGRRCGSWRLNEAQAGISDRIVVITADSSRHLVGLRLDRRVPEISRECPM